MASRMAAFVAAVVLVLLAGAYYFTYEPAPQVTISWRESTTFDRRGDVERWFGLVRERDREERTVTYDLVDTRRENINELLEQPEVEAVGYIDHVTNTIPADAPYGRGWMWIGDRLPEARVYRVVPVIIAVCCLVIAYAFAYEIAARRRRVLRLLAFIVGSPRPGFQSARQRLPDQLPDRLGDRGGGQR